MNQVAGRHRAGVKELSRFMGVFEPAGRAP